MLQSAGMKKPLSGIPDIVHSEKELETHCKLF